MNEKTKTVIKVVILAVVIAVLTILCIPFMHLLVSEEGRAEICEKVRSFGVFAPIVFMLLMALQVVIAFIPGGPLELVGGMLFGSWVGLLVTVIGAFLGTLCVFGLVRLFGKPLVDFFVPEEKAKNFKILQDEEKLEFWVFVLFLIPGIPKDLLTYLVPLTHIRGRDFLLLSTLGRFPSLAASVLVGDSLSEGRYWLAVGICAAAALLSFIGLQIKNRFIKGRSDEKDLLHR
jgi:uncharacterized membrane protein YdjX (TVP38/TMEM64 family)